MTFFSFHIAIYTEELFVSFNLLCFLPTFRFKKTFKISKAILKMQIHQLTWLSCFVKVCFRNQKSWFSTYKTVFFNYANACKVVLYSFFICLCTVAVQLKTICAKSCFTSQWKTEFCHCTKLASPVSNNNLFVWTDFWNI